MISKRTLRLFCALSLLCVAASAPMFAAPIVLTPPTGSFAGFGAGGTRGDIVSTSASLALTSIGIEAQINTGATLTFTAYVWSSDGFSGITPLATGTPTLVTGNGNMMFYDMPISYTLSTGQFYDIGVDFGSFNDANLQIHYYFFDANTNSPFTVSPVTVYDGEESHCGPCNSLTPNLELNGSSGTTPEPGTLVLLGTGAFGLLGSIRRKLIG
jgi:PEP-CTERM motif